MNDWKKIAARMRGDLDRADVSGRARRVAEFAIKATLMQGRTRVVLPNRAELCRLLKVGENHWQEVVAALESARIVKFTSAHEGWELLVFPDSAGWAVDWLYSRDEMAGFLSMLNRAPGQVQGELIEPPVSLNRTLAEVSAMNVQSPKPKAQTSQNGKSGVPEMGSRAVQVTSTQVKPASERTGKTGVQVQTNKLNESALFKRLEVFLGKSPFESDREDVVQWSGYWRFKVIKANPDKFDMCLRMLEGDVHEGREAAISRVAWLKDLLKR